MFKCLECGHIFEESGQKIYKECVGECHGTPAHQEFEVCAICNGAFEEITPCLLCGSTDIEDGQHYCKECIDGVKERFIRFMDAEFNAKERALLNEIYEGEKL